MVKKNSIIFLIIILILAGCSSSQVKKSEEVETKEEYYILKGINYVREGNYTKGLKEYEKAYQKNENNIITLKEIARTYIKLGDYESGIYYYSRALKIDEKDQESLRNIGYAYFLKGDNKKALSYLSRLSLDGTNFETLKLKSYLLYEEKNFKMAYKNFKYVLNQEKEMDLIYYKIFAELLNDMGKKEELRIFLEKGKEKYGSQRDFIIFYSYAAGEYFGEYDLGEKEIKRYIVAYGGNDSLYMTLAYMIYNQKEYAQAESALKLVSYRERYNKEYMELKERLKEKI